MVWVYTGTSADDNISPPAGQGTYTVDGGAGSDTVNTNVSVNSATFTYSQNKTTGVTTLSGASGSGLTMYLQNVENVNFTDYTWSVPACSDTTPPTVSTFSPANAATGVNIASNIVVTFSESVQRGTGNIVLKDAAGTTIETFNAATSTLLSISGNTLTINPTNNLLANGNKYFVTFGSGTIKDIPGNAYAGNTTYNFTTADTTAPTVSTFSPANAATDVAITSDIVVTFSEAVQRGTGNIVLKDAAGTTIETFNAANSTCLSISGKTLTINPTSDLSTSTNYFVTFASGTIKDLAGNAYTDSTTYNFTTAAPVAPKLITGSTFNFLIDPQVTMQVSQGQASLGTVVFDLNPEKAPITVANMLAYVNSGFYDNTLFHRVISGFMVQGGGFTTGLTLKPPTYSAIALESNNGLSNLAGTIAMARTSVADSATTQFFVNQVDNTFLDYSSTTSPGYAVFGEVVSGSSVIDSIAKAPTHKVGAYSDVPVTDITITSLQQTMDGSCITNAATFTVDALEAGATWSYSLDGGATWTAGTGTSFTVPVGNYAASAIEVRQTDAAGKVSTAGKLTSALVVETTAPTVTTFSPANAAAGAGITSNIVITFSEAVQRGTGNIVLKNAAGTTIETFNSATSNLLSISDTTLTINPTSDLANGTNYLVTFASGTIKDLAGNAYAGSTTYNFTTNYVPSGSVTINGTATQGQTLSATSGLTDADGMGTISYQWKANDANISGATSNTYTLTEGEVGKAITVVASYTDGHGTLESKASSATSAVANVNDAGSINISGTATQKQILTAVVSDADGLPSSISYQWKANDTNISGATSCTYVLTEDQVGATITVAASYTDLHGTAESISSSATSAVINVNDAPTGSVTLSGTATQGQTLTAANTLADADGLGAINYQWKANGFNISSATGDTFVLTEAQVGATITVAASYTDGHSTAESVTSNMTRAVANVNDAPTGSVTISGTVIQGQTLTADSTLADADGLGAIRYQWQADGTNISGATNSTFILAEAQVGKTITAVASYTDGHGTAESVTSSATGAVVNINDAPTGGVTISGTATQSQTLTAKSTLADADGLGTISYQWKADSIDINGATRKTYTLTEAQVGKVITVVASYTDGHGTVESVASSETTEIANANDPGSVSITGTAIRGKTLTATESDADGLGAITYQWKADGANITNATGDTYVLTRAQIGKAITVAASYTDGHGTAESLTSSAIRAEANTGNNAPTGSVTLSGTVTQGQTLTAANTLGDADGLGAITYQWMANGIDINGATGNTFVLTEAQVGAAITVAASYTDGNGTAESKTSRATGAVANVNDAPAGGVTLSGTAAKGQTLHAANTLTDADGLGAIHYQWMADGANITNATNSTYILTKSQVGKTITVVASYTDGHDTVESITSAATPAVIDANKAPTGGVTLSGTPTQGQTLTAANTLADADGLGAISYQWKANGIDIGGATNSTFVLTEAQVGKAITAVASYTDNLGTAESKTSGSTSTVANVNDAPTGGVAISGTAILGQTLTATSTLADADGMGDIHYQWKAGNTKINGATGSTYILTEAQVGKIITVAVSYTDGHGTLEKATSVATGSVGDTLPGTTGDDTYTVNNSALKISAEQFNGGTDTINTSVSYTLPANVENMTLTGTAGIDGTGNALGNILVGNSGNNILNGGDGNDRLDGGDGADKLAGGAGDDTYIVDLTTNGALQDTVTEAANAGTDTLQLRSSADLAKAKTLTLASNLENLDASLTGTTLLNLSGNAADNILTGNAADNALNGGAGADILTGGTGNDRFIFSSALNATTNIDTLTDFTAGHDTIQLNKAIFAALGAAGSLNADFFYAGTSAHDANDHIIYDAGALYYDPDGTGAAVQVQFATLLGAPAIASTDLFIV